MKKFTVLFVVLLITVTGGSYLLIQELFPGSLRADQGGFRRLVIDRQGPRDPWGKAAGDLNGDGRIDLIVGGHAGGGLVWYENPSWKRRVIVDQGNFGTDLEVADVDGDGMNDVVSITGAGLVWYRNGGWTENRIDAVDLHDIELADLDHDGDIDIVARDQSAFGGMGEKIYIYRQDAPGKWKRHSISCPAGEGLKVADLNDDGKPDIVVNGVWYENRGNALYGWKAHRFSCSWEWPHTFIAVGDINDDGRTDIVLAPAESEGGKYRISWFEARKDRAGEWPEHVVEDGVETVHHFVGVADMNNDGLVDILAAEMHQGKDPDEIRIYFNETAGSAWKKLVIGTAGSHSMRIADLDGDGDMDFFGANWSGDRQYVELWENRRCQNRLDAWRRHVIDEEKPWRAVFVSTADMNGDGRKDIITGGWWYANPGKGGAPWRRHLIGAPANNMAAVMDIDGDGDMDILATEGKGSAPAPAFAWARNNGRGEFTVFRNIPAGAGDFLQGVAAGRFLANGPQQIALSWHEAGKGIQLLVPPEMPDKGRWGLNRISEVSQDEALSVGDIDRDGDDDLLLGTVWLRNDGGRWTALPLARTTGNPDRNRLADINGDGRLDAVVGFEAISARDDVVWYEQDVSAGKMWKAHRIGTLTGPMSLDVADMDGDGDPDVAVGEHNLDNPAAARLVVFENADGRGSKWTKHVVHTGDEHHDGARITDIDGDGDMDIVSIGWGHGRVLLYENLSPVCKR